MRLHGVGEDDVDAGAERGDPAGAFKPRERG
jgi:hypothetical protein